MQQFLPGLLLTLAQVALGLQVQKRTVHRWVKDGKFPAPIDLNGQIRWKSDHILEWMLEQQVQQRIKSGVVSRTGMYFARTSGEEPEKEASKKPKRD